MSLLNFQDKLTDAFLPPTRCHMITGIVGYTALIGDDEKQQKIETVQKKMTPLKTEQ
ncbi:MAG: hypothetical protein ABUT20_09470 [Bacteroidota bacterium]